MFNYLSFGYIPVGNTRKDVIGRCRGAPNLLKRLEARAIMQVVSPVLNERILDFGYGRGFFSYEMAKRGAHVTGIDIVPPWIPDMQIGNGGMQFVQASPQPDIPLPLNSNTFDKILVSEVYVILPDPHTTTQELFRVLKPGGRLVIVNTLGRPRIEKAYAENKYIFRLLRTLLRNAPDTYSDYVSVFFSADSLKACDWHKLDELTSFVTTSGFSDVNIHYLFKNIPMSCLSWWQFVRVCSGLELSVPFSLPAYVILELLGHLPQQPDSANVIITALKSSPYSQRTGTG